MTTSTSSASPTRPPTGELMPGGLEARNHGCACPVVANASHRAGGDAHPLVDPRCTLHTIS